MADPNPTILPAGGVFGDRYEVLRQLRGGGMGVVYEVLDHRTHRRRALKIMLPSVVEDPELRARFRLEATITAHVDSKHIVEVLDADVDQETGAPFAVMELLKGEDLGEVLRARGAMRCDELVPLLRQAALAIDRCHAGGIVHRDLKPENLFVTHDDDGSPRLKILDFGIAKVVADYGMKTTRAMGTPPFMAPEQIRGEAAIGAQADLYALAHIAYAMLVGEAYWATEAATSPSLYVVFDAILKGLPEPASARALRRKGRALAQGFDAWFARATATKPGDRFASARELVEALTRALDDCGSTLVGEPVFDGAEAPARPAPRGRAARVAPLLIQIAVGLGLAAAVGAAAMRVAAPHLAAPGAVSTAALVPASSAEASAALLPSVLIEPIGAPGSPSVQPSAERTTSDVRRTMEPAPRPRPTPAPSSAPTAAQRPVPPPTAAPTAPTAPVAPTAAPTAPTVGDPTRIR